MAGKVIIITGTSGSGKSTTAKNLVRRSENFCLLFGIDHFLSSMYPTKFSHHGPRAREGIFAYHVDENDPNSAFRWGFGEYGTKAFNAFHEMIAGAARSGLNIVIDHLMFVDPPLIQDCIWRLKDLQVLFVALKPPRDVLLSRIASRPMDKPVPAAEAHGAAEGMRVAIERLQKLTPWFYDASYQNDCYDLTIDSAAHNPDQVCEIIEQRMAQGPGTAFELLRKRYPQ